MPQVTLPPVLTEAELADYLGVTKLTVYRWRKAGKIGFYMVGKSPRFSESHIAEYLASQTIPAVALEPRPTTKPTRKRNDDHPGALAQAHAILSCARKRDGR
ncbi:helix-turn-helix domain-containing protein [Luteibacter aegosomatissinici]|uniref:helix-turn-helix domain-containing protein n=1 Tax=Luteibacter aegosomatissinici TaxID=2911539 RepID=UPI003CCDD23D